MACLVPDVWWLVTTFQWNVDGSVSSKDIYVVTKSVESQNVIQEDWFCISYNQFLVVLTATQLYVTATDGPVLLGWVQSGFGLFLVL
jgi:hypothetical protein